MIVINKNFKKKVEGFALITQVCVSQVCVSWYGMMDDFFKSIF
jgi:hypothetical protein